MEHESDDYTNRGWCFRYSKKKIIKGTRGLGSWRGRGGDHPNYIIIDNSQNTVKSPGDLKWHSNSSESPSANADVKNSQGVNYNDYRKLDCWMIGYSTKSQLFIIELIYYSIDATEVYTCKMQR